MSLAKTPAESAPTPPRPLRVVCLGGGWTAIYLSRALKKAINRGDVDLTIISRDNFHTFHGFIAEMLTGKVSPTNITSPARRLFPPAHFLNAEIKSVDVERRTVTTSRLLDGKETVLSYDHLVVALGSIDDLSRYPGIAQHALQLKTFSDNFRVRNHLLAMLEMAESETDPVERQRLLTFMVVGGGFGGVEVATELMDYFRRLARKEYPGIDPADLRVLLVHSGERILPELAARQPKLIGYAEKTIAKGGVEVLTGTRISAATRDEAILSDGTVVPTRTIISSSGTALSPLLDLLPYERDDRGRVLTDEHVRVPGTDNVWAAGDCAAVPHPAGGTCPAVAIYGMYGGKQIGRNIVRQLEGKPLKRFTFAGLGDACSLGRRKAVSHLKGMRFYGLPAWILWRTFFWWFVPTWERKADIAFDWLCAPFFGRDIVGVGVATPYGLRREHYETGQPVVRQGEVGQAIYVITSGTADIIRETPEGEVLVTTLGPGDHFGEKAVFDKTRRTATVRATSPLEVLSLGEGEARALAETIQVFGAAVRELPNEPAHNPAPLPTDGAPVTPAG